MYPVEIEGVRARLREIRESDVDAAFAVVGDETVTRWLSFDAKSCTETARWLDGIASRAQMQPRTEYYLALTPLDQDQMIGFARLGLEGVRAANLGYAVGAAHWNNGYATDAARAAIRFGFEQLGLHRIAVTIGPDNDASLAVARRLGFTHEGRIRDHVIASGRWRDSVLMSLLDREWAAKGRAHTSE